MSGIVGTILISFLVGVMCLSSFSSWIGILTLLLLTVILILRPIVVFWIAFCVFMAWPYLERIFGSYLPFGLAFVVLFGIYYCVVVLKLFMRKDAVYKFHVLDLLMVMFIIIGVSQFFISNDKSIALLGLKENLKMSFMFLFFRAINPSRKQIDFLIKVVLSLAMLVALYGIYQYFFDYHSLINTMGGVTSELSSRYFGDSGSFVRHEAIRRAYSLFLNSFTLAYFLMIALIVTFSKYLFFIENDKFLRNKSLTVFVLLFCLMLTFTRSAWMGTLMGILAMMVVKRDFTMFKKISFLFVALGSILVVAFIFMPSEIREVLRDRFLSIFSSNRQQTSGHYEFIIQDIKLMCKSPLGIGLGQTSYRVGNIWAESSIFKIVLEMGTLSGVIFLLFFIIGIFKAIKLFYRIKDIEIKSIVLMTIGIMFAYFIAGVIFPLWFSWFPTMILWMLMAYVATLEIENGRSFNNSH